MTIEDYRVIAIAVDSLRYNPNLSDIEIQSCEIALAKIRDYITAQQEAGETVTWADKIRAMGDEELAEFLMRVYENWPEVKPCDPDVLDECDADVNADREIPKERCVKCLLKKLRKEERK